jgi:hypothetical protein
VKWLLIVYSVLTNEYVTFDELPSEKACQGAKDQLKAERKFDPDQGWLSACVLQKDKRGKVPGYVSAGLRIEALLLVTQNTSCLCGGYLAVLTIEMVEGLCSIR